MLCEIARNGVRSQVSTGGAIGTVPLSPEYASALKNCSPFVFADTPDVLDENSIRQTHKLRGAIEVADIDAPFQAFSIECLDGPIGRFTNPDGEQESWCMLTVEISPKHYQFLTLVKERGGERWAALATNGEADLLRYYLRRLNVEYMGLEETNQTVTLGSGKTKARHKIRRIVHVRPTPPPSEATGEGRDIDWSHRFSVRGHWRKHTGLGKDRNGDYCVSGFTWVEDHIKGPEGLPFIKKTRFVERIAK